MKYLKLKSILSAFILVTVLTVFLSSCEKDLVSENVTTDVSNQVDEVSLTEETSKNDYSYFILPHGYENLSKEEIEAYTQNLDDESISKLSESRRIARYFKHIDKFEVLYENSSFGEIFSKETLSKYLSSSEIEGYKNFKFPIDVSNKSGGCVCTNWVFTYIDTYRQCWWVPIFGMQCDCNVYHIDTRNCGGSDSCFFYSELRSRFSHSYDCDP